MLIEAAALPPLAGRDDIVVVLAGDAQGRDDYRRELERLIEARGLTGRVRIVGHCDDAPAAFALADVAVIASTEPEAFGRTAVEAAAMGVPVVATALGATGETVLAPPAVAEAERTGWLVPPGDAAALAAAIGEALRAVAGRARRRLRARARRHAADLRHRGDAGRRRLRFTTGCCRGAVTAADSRNDKCFRELTWPVIRRILRSAVAASAGAAYIYRPQQT